MSSPRTVPDPAPIARRQVEMRKLCVRRRCAAEHGRISECTRQKRIGWRECARRSALGRTACEVAICTLDGTADAIVELECRDEDSRRRDERRRRRRRRGPIEVLAELTGDIYLPALGMHVRGVRVIAQQESRARQQHDEPDGSREFTGLG
jgi:hypothetical protein